MAAGIVHGHEKNRAWMAAEIAQPDLVILCDRNKLKIGVIYGAPDFVLKVLSPSSGKRDREMKLKKYQQAGVREYWLLDPDREQLWVYVFSGGLEPQIYDLSETVKMDIYGGELQIDLKPVQEIAREFGD